MSLIGKDKYGQPILLMRVGKANPKATTEDRVRRFYFFVLEEAVRLMGEDADKYYTIIDFNGGGLSNFSLAQTKQLIPIIQAIAHSSNITRIATRNASTR